MANINITPVILCGGAGSRLWPMSRDDKPKQFHSLFNDKSLLANTVARTPAGIFQSIAFNAPIILGSENLNQTFLNEIKNFDTQPSQILLEPSVRDTAAAIAAITAFSLGQNPDSFLLVLPSDARIDDHEEFRRTIEKAAIMAQRSDAIMTLGIAPTRPETQYGYIEQGKPHLHGFEVKQFREKPDLKTAQKYLDTGSFLWNAGMFMFRTGRMASEFEVLQPKIWHHAKSAVENAKKSDVFLYLNKPDFDAAPKLSIDYAIMEKAGNIGVVPAHFDWDDLGSWTQLYDAAPKDAYENAKFGDAITVQACKNYIRSDGPIVAAAGVEGLTIVAEDNKVLVVQTDQAHLVKDVTVAVKQEFAGRGTLSKAALKNWLFEKALPFWATKGMDFANGGAHEALAFDGSPALHPSKRLRVTARQIYCFAHASQMGWEGDSDYVLRHCFATLIDTGWHKDGGFIHLYNPDGSVQNNKRDTYDHCFVLLGLAWLVRVKKWPEARAWGEKTFKFLDDELSDPIHGGYFECLSKATPRRANPHMHLLEAMLAWYEATNEKSYLDRAEKIVSLFEKVFFDPATNSVTERFNEDWSPITDPNADNSIEPGHHYEWAWLLMRYNHYRPSAGIKAKALAIYATAKAFGHNPKTGAAADIMSPDGGIVSSNARCWPQTEALKAAIIFEKNGLASASAFKQEMLDVLLNHYIDGPIEGGWYDAIDASGNVTAPDMPSSTFYHIFCALAEYIEN